MGGMPTKELPADEVAALEAERAFVDLSDWRKVRVSGADAIGWLNDLLTADIEGLRPGVACRCLLLTPTGRIRADVHVARREDDLVLLQAPDQPEHVGLVLHHYTLSSDVLLEDATGGLALFAVPGRAAALVGIPGTAPSALGPGLDLLVGTGRGAWRTQDVLVNAGLAEVGPVAVEIWRVRRGRPRMGVDFDQDSLPAEVGLDAVIDTAKGCFLGQESVARVRNLGHPPRVLRHVRTRAPVAPGDPVLSRGAVVGTVTSAAPQGGEHVALVRIRWEAAEASLTLADGGSLDRVPSPG